MDNVCIINSSIPLPLDNSNKYVKNKKIEIRENLKLFKPTSDQVLECTFVAKNKRSNSDIENLLFYNIGVSSFKPLIKNGIIFKHLIPCQGNSNILYEYKLIDRQIQNKGKCIFKEIIKINNTINRLDYFIKLREEMLRNSSQINPMPVYESNLSIDITINTASTISFSLHKKIKPMLDGFVSALHKEIISDRKQELIEILNKNRLVYNDSKILFGQYNNGILLDYRVFTIVRYKNGNKIIRMSPLDNAFNNIQIYINEKTIEEDEYTIAVYKN